MEPDPDTDTVLRPQRDVSGIVGEPSDLDADTVIKGRAPFADLPQGALAALRASDQHDLVDPPTEPFSVDQLSTLPHDYSFSINASTPIRLDAPAFIGRRPSLPRVVSGRAPRLVRVPSPLREVSSTHLELRQQGALVIVTDLKSTNGTVVVAPGRDPVKLRGGESIVAVPGTVIDIGDGNIVEIRGLASTPSERES